MDRTFLIQEYGVTTFRIFETNGHGQMRLIYERSDYELSESSLLKNWYTPILTPRGEEVEFSKLEINIQKLILTSLLGV